MAHLQELNVHFKPKAHMSRAQYLQLIAEGRVFKTEARFTDAEAARWVEALTTEQSEQQEANRGALSGIEGIRTTRHRYRGEVIVSTPGSWDEAQRIVAERGIPGERVLGGPVGGCISDDEDAAREEASRN